MPLLATPLIPLPPPGREPGYADHGQIAVAANVNVNVNDDDVNGRMKRPIDGS